MSLTDPLSIAAFYDLLRIGNVVFKPQWMQQQSATGGGETLSSDRAPMRWLAEITTVAMEHAEAEGILALLNSRAGGLKTLLLTNPRLPYPSSDPDGSIFGGATPIVGTITDRLHVAFTGFPNGYQMPLGTFIGITFDTSRRYLGQLAEAKTASGAGAVTTVEVTPALPASVAPGDAVTVLEPPAKFKLVPNSAFISEVSTIHSRAAFSAEQTYAKDPA